MRENAKSITELYQALRPLILRDVTVATSAASASGLHQHGLDRSLHTGTLLESQAPWASTKTDIQALFDQQLLHDRVHVLASTSGLGSDHTVSGLTAGQVLRASGAADAAFAQLQHGDLGGISANQHHNQIHSITGTDHTISAAAMQVVGATATDTLGLLTPLSAPGEASAILKSDSTGKLTLPLMVASTNLQTPLIIAGTGQSLTLQPPLDLIFDPASNRAKMAADVSIEASAYASQTAGWRVTDAGEADFRYLYVDEMHAKSFIADLEQALAGGQIIAKSVAVLYSDFTAPAAGATAALTVRDLPSATGMAVFVDGDYIRLRKFDRSGGSLTIGDCWGTVVLDTTYGVSGFDNATKSQRYTFTRSAGADAGAMAAGTVVYADAIILDYGTAGNGIYEVNAIDGLRALNSPYAQVATWATHPRTMTVKSRLGNLRGIFSIADEYGLYAGSGTGNADRYIRASNEAIELRNVPLALYSGNDNTMLLSAGEGNNSPFLALGSPLPTGPLTNNGIWAGLDGSDYEFRVGTVSAGALVKGLHWTGSDLTWKATNTSLDADGNLHATSATLAGAITANTGYIGYTDTNQVGWTIASGQLTSTNIGLYAGAANTARLQVGSGSDSAGINSTSAGTDIAIWAGDTHANRATADFRVTAAGSMYATTGTIAGDFEVTGGGKLTASGGGIVLTATGVNIGSYPNVATGGTPLDNSKSLTWWSDASAQTGLLARMYASYDISPTNGAYWEIDVAPGTASELGSPGMFIWHANTNYLWFAHIYHVTGLPGLSLHQDPTTLLSQVTFENGTTLSLEAGSAFVAWAHLLPGEDFPTTAYNLGSFDKRWGTVYANNMIISGSISGTSLGGATWTYPGSMVIDAAAAMQTTVTIGNSNATYGANLEVEGTVTATGFSTAGNIAVGGTVDGVDLSAFKTAYDSHNHDVRYYTETELQTSGFAVVHWGNLSSKPTTFAPSAHAYDDAVHTGTLSWSKVSKTGSNLNEIATRSHTVLSDIGTNTHANIDTHINTADTHVAHSGVSILGGNGLTGGGAINATQTLHVAVSGLGLSVGADAVTLSSSSAGEASAHILATNANGHTQVQRLGIGTSPTMPLEAVGSPGAIAKFGSGSHGLYIVNGLNLAGSAESTLSTITSGGVSAGPLALGTGNQEALRITTNSKVGINRTDPTYTLDVSGTGRFTSTLYADDDLYVADLLDVGGNLTVGAGAGVLRVLAAEQRVGINRDADSQFSLDIAGAARASYWVGPHAIQLSGAVAIMHFDGAAPYNRDFSGTPDTHMGVRGTTTGHVLYREGMFGKTVQVAEGTTNYVVNPRFYTDATGWVSDYGFANKTRRTTISVPIGSTCMEVVSTGADNLYIGGLPPNSTSWTSSVHVKRSDNAAISASNFSLWLDRDGAGTSTYASVGDGWYRVTFTRVVSTYGEIGMNFSAAGTYYVTAVQAENKPYATPYHDGDMTAVESWDGTAHASTSTRWAGHLSYPGALLSQTAGTIMMWVKTPGTPAQVAAMNGGNGGCLFSANGSTRNEIWFSGSSPGSIGCYNGTSWMLVSGATWNPGDWLFLAYTWDSTTGRTLYVYTPTQSLSSTGSSVGMPAVGSTFLLGSYAGGYHPNVFVDDFVILDRAATDKEILSIYASNAPVFAESSVFSFRAPTKSNLRVDEYGLWFSGLSDQAIFGMYGGDPARVLTTQSWGGVTMEEGDVVIGRTLNDGAALHWDDSERKLRLGVQTGNHLELTSTTFKIKAGSVEKISLDGSGNASITGALTMGASGKINIDSGNAVLDAAGIKLAAGASDGTGSRALQFWSSAAEAAAGTGSVLSYISAANASSNHNLYLRSLGSGSNTASIKLQAATGAGGNATILLQDLITSAQITVTASVFDVNAETYIDSLHVYGDPGGVASALTLTNVTATAAGATAYSFKMNGATAYENTGWMKIYVGTSVRYIPYWTTI